MGDFISRYKYLRIQGQEVYENTMYAAGVFSMCWSLVQNDVMEDEDADLFKEIDSWFAEILPFPPQCKNQEKVVCFFKTENTKEEVNALLDNYKLPIITNIKDRFSLANLIFINDVYKKEINRWQKKLY